MACEMGTLELEAKSRINLGTLRLESGELDEVEAIALEVLELATKNGMKQEEGGAWELLGDVMMERGNHVWALDCYQRGTRCLEGLAPAAGRGAAVLMLKNVEARCMADETGLWAKLLDEALPRDRAGLEGWLSAASLATRGMVMLERGGDPERAVEELEGALRSLGKDSSRVTLLWRICTGLARACLLAGRKAEAERYAFLAVEVLDRIRSLNEGRTGSFMERRDSRAFAEAFPSAVVQAG